MKKHVLSLIGFAAIVAGAGVMIETPLTAQSQTAATTTTTAAAPGVVTTTTTPVTTAIPAAATTEAAPPAKAAAPAEKSNAPVMARVPGFEDEAEKLLPTVVNVSTTAKMQAPSMKGGLPPMPELEPGSPFEEFFKDFYDQYQQQQGAPGGKQRAPAEQKVSSLGSGFIIDGANGYIVTNNHVIKDADEIKVTLTDNTTLDATLVGTDEKTDIALLKVKSSKPLQAAPWGDSDAARVGSWVLAIGNPFGLGGTVTAGIISARHRDINAGPYDEFLQTDASINRGNSGGPMFNTSGEVIGVNTAIFSPSGGSVGIGFAVPSNIAKNVVEQLIKYGKTKRGWLGVRIQEVTPEIAETLGVAKAGGAMVSSVTPKGPAEKAGLKAGDIILKFDGKAIDEMRQLPRMVAEAEVGKKAALTIWRKGKEETVTVDLGQLETAEASGLVTEKKMKETKGGETKATAVESLGLGITGLTDQLRDQYKVGKNVDGVMVSDVNPDGPAAEKGIDVGDVIVQIDQADVTTPADAASKIEAAQKAGHSSVLLFISHGEDMRFVALKFKK